MKYTIEHWIETLAHNAVMDDKDNPASFVENGIHFYHLNFNFRDGLKENAWTSNGEIEAENYISAINIFRNKLSKLIPRISFVSQAYIDFVLQPFLIKKEGSEIAFFRYTKDRAPGPLMFMEKELEALRSLIKADVVPEKFYFYWNDAVNSFGYTSKLLSMTSAIECLTKKANGDADWEKRKLVLGKDLVAYLWSSDGLRHRLSHGDYYTLEDEKQNYLEVIHRKVLDYFNREVFKKNLLNLDVVNPQRHFFGNKKEGRWFIRAKAGNNLNLKEVVQDFHQNGIHDTKKYEYEWGVTNF